MSTETTPGESRAWTLSGLRPKSRTLTPKQVLAVAIAAGALTFLVTGQTETAIVRGTGATGHELEWISDVMAAMAVTTLTYLWLHLQVARSRLLDSERARIVQEEQFRLAAEMQRALLPDVPRETSGYEWAARMEAAYHVGGDLYDFVITDEGNVVVMVGDVSGKGMPAAMMQSALATLFRVHASRTSDPETIASSMSRDFLAQVGGKRYATAILARLDRSPRRITYVNAGHPPGLVRQGTTLLELTAGGPPLGMLSDARYERASIDLAPDDAGIFVTDGVTESLEGIGLTLSEALGSGHLSRMATPQDGCEYLLRTAASSPGPRGVEAWSDDRTVLAFRVLPDRPI